MSSRSTPTGSRETDMPATGTQIYAPRGYLNLEQGAVYHFLQSNENTKLVSLVQFIAPAPDQGVQDVSLCHQCGGLGVPFGVDDVPRSSQTDLGLS